MVPYDNARGFENGQETTKSIAVVDLELEKELNDLEHCAVTTKRNAITDNNSVKECGNCGYKHQYGKCAAYGQKCYNCNRLGHSSKYCRQKRFSSPGSRGSRRGAANSMLANVNSSLKEY